MYTRLMIYRGYRGEDDVKYFSRYVAHLECNSSAATKSVSLFTALPQRRCDVLHNTFLYFLRATSRHTPLSAAGSFKRRRMNIVKYNPRYQLFPRQELICSRAESLRGNKIATARKSTENEEMVESFKKKSLRIL